MWFNNQGCLKTKACKIEGPQLLQLRCTYINAIFAGAVIITVPTLVWPDLSPLLSHLSLGRISPPN